MRLLCNFTTYVLPSQTTPVSYRTPESGDIEVGH